MDKLTIHKIKSKNNIMKSKKINETEKNKIKKNNSN